MVVTFIYSKNTIEIRQITMQTPLYIDNQTALEKLCKELKSAPHIALDTEFLREKTYSARLCLIQIATEQSIACIDPFKLDSLDPFMEILFDRHILKILHSARQDLEIFHDLSGKVPGPIFDTQIAATLLGLPDQCGYATLVKQLLNIELDKTQTRTDWSRRPLDVAQLDYAADDVRYLIQLYPLMLQQLKTSGREDWLSDDFLSLETPDIYQLPLDNLWKKVSGHARLKGKQLAIVKQLAIWREKSARAQDLPRKWILADDVIIALARIAPEHPQQMEKIRGLDNSRSKNRGEEILAEIKTARDMPKEQWPLIATKKTSKEEDVIVDLLMSVLKFLAQKNGISPAILGTRKDVEKLLTKESQPALMQGWRKHIAGKMLEELLEGQQLLKIQNRKLNIEHIVSEQK
ncbi:Ribonuclease D [hydrothermal vent metagenome]|uniref:Ribonuclease D n=1 Tax=hydrothermal vent metagenome TaxID=652676 RepID=A0A3B1B1T9_9ZZZZ